MKKVLFVTNLPAPYKITYFNRLSEQVDLTVIYERENAADRDSKWKSTEGHHFHEIWLHGKKIGNEASFAPEIVSHIKKNKYDVILMNGYSSPTMMMTIAYMRLKHIKFGIICDGMLPKQDSYLSDKLKQFLISSADFWMSSGKVTSQQLEKYGADSGRIFLYPFSSLTEDDLSDALTIRKKDKNYLRSKLGMSENKIILSVGRFTYDAGYGKGYDTLLKVAGKLKDQNIGIYIVGDEPTEEFLNWKREEKLARVHFIGFKSKDNLAEYYAASDLFVLLTRGDVWGLVINEAMMFGLPVITTDACVAGVELVKDNRNGFIVPVDSVKETTEKIEFIFEDEERLCTFGRNSLNTIQWYTTENMAIELAKIIGGGYWKLIRDCARAHLKIKEEYVWLYVGQVIPRKGIDILIKAFEKSGMPSSRLFIVGGSSEHHQLPEKSNIEFVDFKKKEELADYYRAADVFILPTREDIWGLVVNEALSYGLPVITTNRCGAGLEMIDNGRNGYVVSIDNAEEINEAFCKIINQRSSAMPQLSALRSAHKYTIDSMAGTTMRVIDLIAG